MYQDVVIGLGDQVFNIKMLTVTQDTTVEGKAVGHGDGLQTLLGMDDARCCYICSELLDN